MKLNKALAICQLYERIKTKVVPISTAFKLNKLYRALKENADFYQKTFTDLIQTYSLKDENGNLRYNEDKTIILIIPEKMEECNTRLRELDELDVAAPEIKFSESELEPLGLSLEEVEILIDFID